MPNIPIYNAPYPQIDVKDLASESWMRAGREIGALGREGAEQTRRGFQEVAQNIEQAGKNLQQHQDYTDRIDGLKSLTDQQLQYKNQLDYINKNLTGDEQQKALTAAYQNFHDGLDQWQTKFAGASKETQLWAQERVSENSLKARHDFTMDTAISGGNKSVIDLGTIANNIAGTITGNPTTADIDHALTTWDQAVKTQGNSLLTTDPTKNATIQKGLQAHQEQIVQTGIYNAIRSDPKSADTLIPYYASKGMLTPEAQRSLRGEAEAQTRANFYQDRATEEAKLRDDKIAANRALTDLTTSTFALGPDNKPSGERFIPTDYFSKLVTIAGMPGADHATIRAANEDAKEILNRSKNGVVATTDQPTYKTLFAKAYNGLTDQDVFNAHAQGKLSDHDSTMLHQAVTDAAHNPQMTQNKEMFDGFIKDYSKFLTKTTLMQVDALGDQRLQQFTNDKWQAFQQGLSKGIAPHDLLDQANPNFIGKDIQRYQVPFDVRKNTIANPTKEPAPLSPVAPAHLPGESEVDYLARLRAGKPAARPAPPDVPAILPPAAPAAPTIPPAGVE